MCPLITNTSTKHLVFQIGRYWHVDFTYTCMPIRMIRYSINIRLYLFKKATFVKRQLVAAISGWVKKLSNTCRQISVSAFNAIWRTLSFLLFCPFPRLKTKLYIWPILSLFIFLWVVWFIDQQVFMQRNISNSVDIDNASIVFDLFIHALYYMSQGVVLLKFHFCNLSTSNKC